MDWPRAVGAAAHPTGNLSLRPSDREGTTRGPLVAALAVVAWAAAGFVAVDVRLVTLAPQTQTVVATASALAWVFGALILFRVPVADETDARRLRWVGAVLLAAGLGALAVGELPAMVAAPLAPNTAMYAANAVWLVVGAFCVIGLVPDPAPRFAPRPIPVALVVGGVAAVVALTEVELLPSLVRRPELTAAVLRHRPPLPGLTGWHRLVGAVPLGLTAAALGARGGRGNGISGWLAIAMVLAAGSLAHDLLWPSSQGDGPAVTGIADFDRAHSVAGVNIPVVNIANQNQDLVVTGTVGADATAVAVSIPGGAPIAATLTPGRTRIAEQTWEATIPAAALKKVPQGRFQVTAEFTGPNIPAAEVTQTADVLKDTVAPAKPNANPKPGASTSPRNVRLTAPAGAEIRYTTGAGAPNRTYAGVITVNRTTTIRAQAVDQVGNTSPVVTFKDTIRRR